MAHEVRVYKVSQSLDDLSKKNRELFLNKISKETKKSKRDKK